MGGGLPQQGAVHADAKGLANTHLEDHTLRAVGSWKTPFRDTHRDGRISMMGGIARGAYQLQPRGVDRAGPHPQRHPSTTGNPNTLDDSLTLG